jgi:hypothetical protein
MEPSGGQTLEQYARKLRAMSSQEFKAEAALPHNKFGEEVIQKESQRRLQIATLRWTAGAAIVGLIGVVAVILKG